MEWKGFDTCPASREIAIWLLSTILLTFACCTGTETTIVCSNSSSYVLRDNATEAAHLTDHLFQPSALDCETELTVRFQHRRRLSKRQYALLCSAPQHAKLPRREDRRLKRCGLSGRVHQPAAMHSMLGIESCKLSPCFVFYIFSLDILFPNRNCWGSQFILQRVDGQDDLGT